MAYMYHQKQIANKPLDEEMAEPTIFGTHKILVAIQTNSTSTANQPTMKEKKGNHQETKSSRLEIKYACSGFRQTFGYHDATTIPFSALLGAATNMETLSKIEECVLRGHRSLPVWMNLYTSHGKPLSLHLSIFTNRGNPELQKTVQTPTIESNVNGGLDSFNLDGSFGTVKAVIPKEKCAMISIRSAAVVGHAKISGMGMLGVDRVTEEAKQAYFARLESK